MISAEICNPANGLPYMDFVHHKTRVVAVPHGEKSILRVQADRVATLIIEAGGEEVSVVGVSPPGVVVDLSQLNQPHVPSRTIGGFVPTFEFGPFKHVKRPVIRQRLYAFRAIIKAGAPEGREHAETLARFEFHMLCDVDFHWARALHLRTLGDPLAAAKVNADTAAEGTCPHCREISARLKKDWSYET